MSPKCLFLAAAVAVLTGCARLEKSLLSPDEKARQSALKRLEHADSKVKQRIIPVLIDSLGNENGNVRMRTIQALSRLGQDAVGPLSRALQHADPRVRAGAAETLGLVGPEAKSAVGALVEAEKDPNEDVQMWALVSLNRIKSSMTETEQGIFRLMYGKKEIQAQPGPELPLPDAAAKGDLYVMIQTLRSRDVRLRYKTILALLEQGPLAVPPLVEALSDSNDAVRDGAAEALRAMTNKEEQAAAAFVQFLKEGDPKARAASEKAFKGLDRASSRSVPALARLARHDNLCVRLEALEALRVLGPTAKDAAADIRPVLSDPNPLARHAALKALERMESMPPSTRQKDLADQLSQAWSEMLTLLARRDIEKALSYFAQPQREKHRAAFRSLGEFAPVLAKSLSVPLDFKEAYGERFVTLEGRAFIEGVEQEVVVQFVQEPDGAWRIRSF